MAENRKNGGDTKTGKKKNRRAYLNDFYRDAAGSYVYSGKLYTYCGQRLTLRGALARLWGLAGGALCALLVCGVVPAPAMMGTPYVVLPYAAALCAAASMCWALGRLTGAGDPLREYVYEQTVQKLPGRCMLAAAACGLAGAGQLIYLLAHGFGGHPAASLLFLFLVLAASAAAAAAKKCLSVLEWRTNL